MPVNDSATQKSIDDIIYQIKLGKVIPIIGYDLLFNEFDSNSGQDFLKRLIKIHAQKNPPPLPSENNMSGYELINSYYHNMDDNDTFKIRLSETIQEQRFNWNLIPESYRKIVSIRHFKLFINATFTNTLELAINAYRAKGQSEQEIKASYQTFNYHPTEPQDLPNEAPNPRFQLNFENPVIYNLFGIHDEQNSEYVLTDADYMELIYDLIINKNENFINLLSYLNGGYLLFLGCNFPDWFFRFFIRICVGNRLDQVAPIKRKSLIDQLADPSRSVFVSYYKIHTLDIDCNHLLDEIYRKLSAEPGTPSLLQSSGNNNVFISYCRNDEQVAKDMAQQFDEKYIEYFWDKNNLRTGNNLNKEITDAIDKCCVFLPIVSSNISASSPYVWMEWKYAVDTQKLIWPVFKEFVIVDMLLPSEFGVTADIRNKILNKNTTLGIIPEGENNKITDASLKEIKQKQYLSRVSGNKTTINV